MSRIANTSASQLANIIKTTGRNDKDTDVLMRAGVKKLKIGENAGKMMGLLKGVNDNGAKALRNILMGRAPADKNDIINLMTTRGMTPSQISEAFNHVKTDSKGRYIAKSVEEAISKATTNPNKRTENHGVILGSKDGFGASAYSANTEALKNPIDDYRQ